MTDCIDVYVSENDFQLLDDGIRPDDINSRFHCDFDCIILLCWTCLFLSSFYSSRFFLFVTKICLDFLFFVKQISFFLKNVHLFSRGECKGRLSITHLRGGNTAIL